MSSTEKSFKILIAGGGVAGLVLANMLERFQIDYLLLEAHGNIVPTIGAGIGIFPNGARILDQLDLFEPIAELSNTDEQGNHIHKENGDCLLCVSDFYNHLKHRHGYPIAFVDRKSLLRVLYNRLQNKNRVLLNKKVDRVELLDGGVEVFTTDGQSVRGSLLIGADGVHSAVRREMFRIANEKTPEYFAVDEHQHSSCHYLCVFGISQDVPDWVHGQIYHVLGRGYSQLVVSGLDPGQVYWFFFEKLPETKYGKDIPRCNREMEARIINKYEHCPVTKTTTLGQIYAKRKISTLTPLHEYTHEKWFFNRIYIIGDAAHKLNPISGQGGNAAIESAAEFVNELLEKRVSRAEGLDGLTDKDITDIFMRVQSARHDRAKDLVSAAHLQQSLTAYEKPLVAKFLYEYRLPLGGNSAFLDLFGEKFVSGPRLKYLPMKGRPRLIPYDDELPSRPWPSRIVLLLQAFFILGFAYLLLKAQNLSNHSWLWFDNRNKTMTTFVTATDASGIFNDPFSSVFMQPDTEKQVVYNIYRLSQLISPILIYIVEGYRLGNRTSILALPSLFLLAIQYKGIALVSPIYAILSTFFSTSLLTGRFVKPEVARALVPALMLGYVFPTMLILFDAFGIAKWVTWVSHAYRFAPFFVCSLTFSFAYLGRIGQSIDKTQKDREQSDCKDCKAQDEFESYKGQDVPILKFAYLFAFALQAMVHITLFAYAYKEPITTMSQIVFQSYRNNNNHLSIGQTTDLFSSDLAVAFTTWFISNIYSIWKLRCLGYIKTQDGLVSTLSVLAGQIVVGPGATWAGLWHWREGVLVGLQSV